MILWRKNAFGDLAAMTFLHYDFAENYFFNEQKHNK